MYKVKTEKAVSTQLSKISTEIARRIILKIYDHLAKSPRELGKPLTGEYKGLYRYKCFNDYRVIYRILEAEKTIIIKVMGHRKDIYR